MTPSILLCAFALISADPVAVDVRLMSGDARAGRLSSITATELVLEEAGSPHAIPLDEVLAVASKSPPAPPAEGPLVQLVDGSQLVVSSFRTSGSKASLEWAAGKTELPLDRVRSVRLATPQPKWEAAWTELGRRESRRDQLAVVKKEAMDHIDGVAGAVDDQSIRFALDGDELTVKRERVYGVIYVRKMAAKSPPVKIVLRNGSLLHAKQVRLADGALQVQTVADFSASLPLDALASIDFGGGRLAYLSSLEPLSMKHTSQWFPEPINAQKLGRDLNLNHQPLRLGRKTYARGLALHSRMLVRYRLGGDYRKFQAVVGIDDEYAHLGEVRLVISGDGKTLLDRYVEGFNPAKSVDLPPQPLDLDVAGVDELEILVDYGEEYEFGDHLILADAKLVK